MSNASYALHGPVAVITLDNPPVNGLGLALRQAIVAGIDAAAADPAVQALVLIGNERFFSGGADVREFGTPKAMQEPTLLSVIAAVERSPKPVIAAISGVCMGGGLELALGCHFRIAHSQATVALPEVKLGLLPGAGGTQRLPRVVGLETALNMIVSGAQVPAAQLKATALFDEVVDSELLPAALALAHKVVAEGRGLPRVRDRKVDAPNAEAFLQFARNTVGAMSKQFPAPLKCLEAVAASVSHPFDAGQKIEREGFLALMQTPESRALRHVFAAERAASKISDVPADTPVRPIAKVGVIGAGTMGGGIAMNFLNAGIPVVMLETKAEALERGVGTIRKNYENSLKKGKLTQDKLDARMALLQPTLDYADLAEVDLVIEAVFEDMGVKQQVFEKLDSVCKPGAILASNTSTLDLNQIAAFTKRPQDVVGLHFFSPANVMRLLEVVRGDATAQDVLATSMALAKTIKKQAVVSGVCDGFIGNRMVARYGQAAHDLVVAGALPQQVDKALEKFGLAMGPFRMGDLAGLDIGWAIRKRRNAENPLDAKPNVADALCEADRFGQKTGAGWYRYIPGNRAAQPDPVTEETIVAFRAAHGITPRKISDEEIIERCVYALVNEGARIVEEGIAQRASDVDIVYLNGYGFPLHRGGPMLYADQVGLVNVERALKRFAAEPGADVAFWTPAALLSRLAAANETFN
ncbi:MAG: 3-hydroxyacyl-CoA dehydrogenase NAD-binding domain-containing protein [Aquabacterium sp.]|jgi:3-hydroxyacyl-CoA dehydrogenase|uniref:3-hydroxyacyl-CoA dehydrogenase NAD-binding domain-containing protein n=1 Tax=Aquabacterium sp. TaxID=1872578 RepID=UPI002A36BA71|nr:3-hydroxyacyl-CoA dehydrogenase NAD-binding domain-containing protein [Aquabacterium sp.]MDX9844884.1 3-hydroxyacyl-CoA dehydrogenase NAD-binding domain-containing protein [Aquabacterium sp.]